MAKPLIFLVDDDADLLALLAMRLEAAGYQTESFPSAEAALNRLQRVRAQLLITDMQMGGMSGMELFEQVSRTMPSVPVIMLTAFGTIPDAVAAVQRGMAGYLPKPFDSRVLLEQVDKALRWSAADADSRSEPAAAWRASIITQSAKMEEVIDKAQRVATGDASVLIAGDSGTGKELLAQAIHSASPRATRPFIAVNCAAIPEPLLESELFGHVKGAFSGAVRDHTGLFLAANGGTLFLDEIGDMPLLLQAKLLRVLQERQVRPVGAAHTLPVDVRVISATHRDLRAAIAAGQFREDLYYRLHVVGLTIPALAERREDIPLLANYFLRRMAEKYARPVQAFSPQAMELLVGENWPGNVRQLMNVVEQCVALSSTPLIPLQLVQDAMQKASTHMISLEEARSGFEREYLVRVLKITAGNVSQAAKLAGRNRTEFYKLLHRHAIDPTAFKA